MIRVLGVVSMGVVFMCASFAAAQDQAVENGPVEPTFKSIQTQVFQARCVKCHGPGGLESKIPLVKYSDLFTKPLVVAGDSSASLLYRMVSRKDPLRMPPFVTGAALSEETIGAIKSWIDQGAKDN